MMWLNPAAFACLALIPVVLLLHALRYRRRNVHVSTLFLWESVMREAHGGLGLRRFVQNLPLLCQLLFVLLLTAALANPVLTTPVAESKDIVLVLDVSASMQTRTPRGTRFAQAQEQALAVVRTLPSGRQMALIAAGRQPQVVQFFTAEKALLRQAITTLQPSDAPGNMYDAILLALSFTQGSGAQEVVIISDGAYGPLPDLAMARPGMRHLLVTGGETNVGIVRLALRKLPEPADVYEILVAVKNFATRPLEVPLHVTLFRKLLLERHLQLQPGQEEVVVEMLTGPLKGVVQAEITVDDDFPLDNRAYSVVATPSQTWILLVGESNFFLETLLTSLPGVLVNVVPQVTEEMLPRLLEANHVLIFNGVQPPPLRRGNVLLINTLPQDSRFSSQGTLAQPRLLDWKRQHPLLQFVDLAEVRIEEALALQLQGGVESIVDGQGTALVSVLDEGALRLVTFAFDLMRSDLPLRVAFPVLMHNILRWFAAPQADSTAGHIQAGMPYAVFFEKPETQVTVQAPQGKQREYPVSGNPWILHDTHHLGVYILRAGEAKHYLAVNLLDATESAIVPPHAVALTQPDATASVPSQAGVIETPLWLYLVLGALLLLAGEWYLWCRDF